MVIWLFCNWRISQAVGVAIKCVIYPLDFNFCTHSPKSKLEEEIFYKNLNQTVRPTELEKRDAILLRCVRLDLKLYFLLIQVSVRIRGHIQTICENINVITMLRRRGIRPTLWRSECTVVKKIWTLIRFFWLTFDCGGDYLLLYCIVKVESRECEIWRLPSK